MAEGRRVSQSIANGLGFSMSGSRWTIKRTAQECIIKEMGLRGFKDGKVELESTRNDNFYRFDFPDNKKTHSFRIEYDDRGLIVFYDPDEVEKENEWGGEDSSAENRMDLFFLSMAACSKTLGKRFPMMKQPVAPFQESPPQKYGYADEGKSSELDDAFGKLSFGKGRKKTRRSKKRRSTRRRK